MSRAWDNALPRTCRRVILGHGVPDLEISEVYQMAIFDFEITIAYFQGAAVFFYRLRLSVGVFRPTARATFRTVILQI